MDIQKLIESLQELLQAFPQTAMSSFLELSQEIIVHVLSYLHYVDLNACRRVNRAFDRLIKNSTQLQYSMQLQLSGYRNNPHSPLVLADKLKLLRNQESSWGCLDFGQETSIRIPFHPSCIYDLTDGVLLLGESFSGRQYGADSLRWAKLSQILSQGPGEDYWNVIDVGAHIIDVGLAVEEHDLIIAAVECVQSRSFPTLASFLTVRPKPTNRRSRSCARATPHTILHWSSPSTGFEACSPSRDPTPSSSVNPGTMQRVHWRRRRSSMLHVALSFRLWPRNTPGNF